MSRYVNYYRLFVTSQRGYVNGICQRKCLPAGPNSPNIGQDATPRCRAPLREPTYFGVQYEGRFFAALYFLPAEGLGGLEWTNRRKTFKTAF